MTEKAYKILLVDDMPSNLQILGMMLKKYGYKIFMSQNGEDALNFTNKEEPDLILLDIMMPGIDGIEVCRRIKADPLKKHIPIIFITAVEEISKKVMAFEVGGEDYITKPFAEREVIARVDAFFQRKEQVKALAAAEEQYRQLFHNSPIPMLMFDEKGERLEQNKSLLSLTETKDLKMQQFLLPDDKDIWSEFIDQIKAGKNPETPVIRCSFHESRELSFQVLYQSAIFQNETFHQFSFVDISEFKKMEEMKNSFISTASHELRTPLTSIKGYAHSIRKYGDMDQETRNSFLDTILEESDRLERMVAQMLDLSRMDTNRKELQIQSFDLFLKLSEMINEKSNTYPQDFHLSSSFQTSETENWIIYSDWDKVKQILENILANAAKYSGPASQVKVELSKNDGYFDIAVIDQGKGIPVSELGNIFERFYRLENNDSITPGSGLGLSISRELASLLEGTIMVDSKLGEGSRFTIRIKDLR